eukprot:scaffold2192_cov200-Alexandrium_tamarense.AAC.30
MMKIVAALALVGSTSAFTAPSTGGMLQELISWDVGVEIWLWVTSVGCTWQLSLCRPSRSCSSGLPSNLLWK